MKKKTFGYKLSRGEGARRALFKSLSRALFINGSIETTKTKAFAVRPKLVKMIKLSQKGDLASKRKIYSMMGNDRETSEKIFSYGPLVKAISGFTKIEETVVRKGDRAQMVRLSLVTPLETKIEKEKKKSSEKSDKKKKKEKKTDKK